MIPLAFCFKVVSADSLYAGFLSFSFMRSYSQGVNHGLSLTLVFFFDAGLCFVPFVSFFFNSSLKARARHRYQYELVPVKPNVPSAANHKLDRGSPNRRASEPVKASK